MEINKSRSLLTDSVERMIIDIKYKMPFYGQFNLMVNFSEFEKKIPSIGVNMTRKGMNLYYNNKFLNELCTTDGIFTGSEEEIEMKQKERNKMVNFIILHQSFHLLFNHPQKTVGGRFDPYLANVAQDMIINSIIYEDFNKEFISIPKYPDTEENRLKGIVGRNMTLFLPTQYILDDGGSPIFEEVYTWLRDKKISKEMGKDISVGDTYGPYGSVGYNDTVVNTFTIDHILENINETHGEYLDVHLEDEIPDELRESYIRDALDRLRSRSLIKEDIDKTLMKLRKKRKDYLREIKRSVSNEIMGTRKTPSISRPNRRQIKGIKGHKKVKSRINVILDGSTSMQGMFDKVLEYVFQNDIEININELDGSDIRTIRSMKELGRIDTKSLGHINVQSLLDRITGSSDYNRYNTVILTDGRCGDLNMKYHKGRVLGISCGDNISCRYPPKKGFKEIIIEPTR